jgi:drug/metabolite transporter (DMT)-like permease
VLWGLVPLAGKIALPGITAASLSVVRLLLGSLFLAFIIGRADGLKSLLARPPRLIFPAALGLACNYIFYMLGLERAGAATTQVLIQLAPLFLILLSIVWLKERPSARQGVGAVLALSGVFLVSWASTGGSADSSPLGIAFVIVSALTWGGYAAVHKRLGERHASSATMMWIFFLAALLIAPTIPTEAARKPDGVQLAAIAFLCANTIVAYWCFAESLRHIEASVVAVITTLGPVVTLCCVVLTNRMGWERIGFEELGPGKLAGAALVLGGVALAATTNATRREPPPA